jgi:hypothetical protein
LLQKERKELEKYGKPTNTKMTLAMRAEQREKERLQREAERRKEDEAKVILIVVM